MSPCNPENDLRLEDPHHPLPPHHPHLQHHLLTHNGPAGLVLISHKNQEKNLNASKILADKVVQ